MLSHTGIDSQCCRYQLRQPWLLPEHTTPYSSTPHYRAEPVEPTTSSINFQPAHATASRVARFAFVCLVCFSSPKCRSTPWRHNLPPPPSLKPPNRCSAWCVRSLVFVTFEGYRVSPVVSAVSSVRVRQQQHHSHNGVLLRSFPQVERAAVNWDIVSRISHHPDSRGVVENLSTG